MTGSYRPTDASLQLPLDNRENKNSQNVCLSQIRENIFPQKFLLKQYFLDYVDKDILNISKYMFKNIGALVLHKVKKALTKLQSALFILHCQLCFCYKMCSYLMEKIRKI